MHIMKKPRGPVKFQQRVQMHSIFMHCNMISALKVAETQVANLQIFPNNKVAIHQYKVHLSRRIMKSLTK